jgi:hypothetical protein
MISNELIQQAIITKLKANTPLVNWLEDLSAGSEIRESQWQGVAFTYPAVRVEAGTQVPDGNLGTCHTSRSELPFTVISFSDADSSRQADILAGLVNAALFGVRLTGTGFASMIINSDGLIHAARTAERAWRAVGLYRMKLYET